VAVGRGHLRLLLVRSAGHRSDSPALSECPSGRPIPVGTGPSGPAADRAEGALRARQAHRATAPLGRGRVLALQPQGVPPAFSPAVPCDRAPAPGTISAHAALGPVPGPARRRQNGHGASVPAAARAKRYSGSVGPLFSP